LGGAVFRKTVKMLPVFHANCVTDMAKRPEKQGGRPPGAGGTHTRNVIFPLFYKKKKHKSPNGTFFCIFDWKVPAEDQCPQQLVHLHQLLGGTKKFDVQLALSTILTAPHDLVPEPVDVLVDFFER